MSEQDTANLVMAANKLISVLVERNARLVAALESIAANTCCDKCQEAALVARKALSNQ